MRVIARSIEVSAKINQLERDTQAPSPFALSNVLKRLQRDGIVDRAVLKATPPAHTSYSLTPRGRALAEAASPLVHWLGENLAAIELSREASKLRKSKSSAPPYYLPPNLHRAEQIREQIRKPEPERTGAPIAYLDCSVMPDSGQIPFDDLRNSSGGRVGRSDVPCPECGPGRKSPHNRIRRVFRIWDDGEAFISFHCERCQISGWAKADGASGEGKSRPRPVAAPVEPEPDRERGPHVPSGATQQAAVGTPVERYLHCGARRSARRSGITALR